MASLHKQIRPALQQIRIALTQSLIELVYPTRCIGCGRLQGSLFCSYCVADIYPPDLSIPIEGLDDYVSVGAHRTQLRDAIHALKYENLPQISDDLGFLLADAVLQNNWQYDTLIPVPLHQDRLQKRGYNQANELAQVAAIHLECDNLPDALHRLTATAPQVGKNLQERQQNVNEAFAVSPAYASYLMGKTVILVDDVCTTGATLVACATSLRRVGVKTVYAATISRADRTTAGAQA